VGCKKRKKALKGETSSAKVTSAFMKLGNKSNDAVLAAEGVLAFHTVKHHSSYKTADCTSIPLTLFPDSEIARKFSRARTRTEAIINSVIAPHVIENISRCSQITQLLPVELPQMHAITMLGRSFLL
jgi:hypothetical protein